VDGVRLDVFVEEPAGVPVRSQPPGQAGAAVVISACTSSRRPPPYGLNSARAALPGPLSRGMPESQVVVVERRHLAGERSR
jgi:hypothetical protein